MEISSFPKAAATPQSAPHALPNEALAVSSSQEHFWRTEYQEQRDGLTFENTQEQRDGLTFENTQEQRDGLPI